MVELTETCMNQEVINYIKIVRKLSKVTEICQLFVVYDVLIRTCLSIRPLFPCSDPYFEAW